MSFRSKHKTHLSTCLPVEACLLVYVRISADSILVTAGHVSDDESQGNLILSPRLGHLTWVELSGGTHVQYYSCFKMLVNVTHTPEVHCFFCGEEKV